MITTSSSNRVDLSSSCYSGICNGFASILFDELADEENLMDLNDYFKEKSFSLLCISLTKFSMDIIDFEFEDNLYKKSVW